MKQVRRGTSWIWAVGVVIASLLVIWPLLKHGFFVSDDGEWMVIRLSAFYQSLAAGQFPVRFLGRLNHNYGYPVANFLYPGFLYIGSLLHLLNVSFVDVVKWILIGSVVGGGLCVFYALRTRYKEQISFVGALSFLYAPYLLYDMYHRGSVGEVLALFPAAVLIYAISSGAEWLIPPMFAFLLVSHNTAGLLLGGAAVVLALYSVPWRRVIWQFALGLGMASFFWLPALVERSYVRFDSTMVSDPTLYFITPARAMLLGLPTLVSVGVLLGFSYKRKIWDTVMCALILLGYGMALPISAPLWQSALLTRLVQFPYRFLLFPVLLGPWIVARVWKVSSGWKKGVIAVLFAGLWIQSIILQQSAIQFVDRPIGYYTTNEGTTTVADEYMPRWVSKVPQERMVDVVDVISGNVNLSKRTFPKESIETTVEAKTDGIVQINKVYYPGWMVAINGAQVPIDYENPFGFMRIHVNAGTHRIRAVFRETPFRFAADVLSVIAVIAYMVTLPRLLKRS